MLINEGLQNSFINNLSSFLLLDQFLKLLIIKLKCQNRKIKSDSNESLGNGKKGVKLYQRIVFLIL